MEKSLFKRDLKTKQTRNMGVSFGIMVLLIILAAYMALPFVYAIIQSFKPVDELFAYPPRFFVINPTLDNYYQLSVLTSSMWIPFGRFVLNSVFIAVTGTFFSVVFASMAALPLAKLDFPGAKIINKIIVVALLFSAPVMSVPQYIIMAKLGVIDSYWALLLPQLASTMGLFLMKNFMTQIPDVMIDAARIDGANLFTIFWRIAMPLVKPAWLTLIIFAFQGLWASSDTAFIYTEKLKLMPTVLNQIVAAGGTARMGVGSAITVLMLIPPILVFLITQSNILETMAHSGIKE